MENKRFDKIEILIILVLVLLFSVRVYNLDNDLPAWGIVNYQPMDEGQYSTMALNKYNSGSIRLDLKLENIDFLTSAHIRNNVIGNFFVYIGMLLFGDNYYGFRISSVLFGTLNYILFLLILRNIKKIYGKEECSKWNNSIYVAMGVLLLVDFVYTVASRVIETSIYRMFFIQLIIFLFTIPKQSDIFEQKIRFLIAGILSVGSVFAVYITNIFIPIAMFATIIFCAIYKGKEYFFNAMFSFIAGAGIAYVLCDLYYNIVWGTSCIVNTMQIISDFSGTNGYTGGTDILALFGLLLHFLSANSNLYNASILYMFLLLLPIVGKLIIRKKDINMFLVYNTIFFLLLQTFINEDYIVRKYIMVYPLLLYLIYYILVQNTDERVKGYFENKKTTKIVYSIFCCMICSVIVLYRLYFIENETYKDFSSTDKNIIMVQLIFILIAEIIFIISICKLQFHNKIYRICFFNIILFSSIITNVYFSGKHVYFYNSYTERELMKNIANDVGDEWVYGVYAISFTLYNDIKPIVNNYTIMGKEIENFDGKWYLDYSDYCFPQEVMGNKKNEWIEKQTYKRNFSTFGTKRSVSLYEIEH